MSTPQEHQRFIDRAWYGPPRSEWRRRFRWVAYIAWYWTHLFSLLVASSLRQDADATLKKAGIAGIVSGSIFHFLLAVTFVAGSRLNHLLWYGSLSLFRISSPSLRPQTHLYMIFMILGSTHP
ncbi:hypothetical protein CC1G_10994 [Coprinopsis cinerea okayama7|uniref:Integral membrane protein n=1 Tax=Coprinopsis cinerea (strain Okayama-7 / 130 / ATCC MYA-4618 / FGSC 9003) TaxID=240176 RepID=A8P720_COPC7|nr:hypothetical protein CC1G_10994 [Coprinopsis cinerea okayama7\|eukprot:XP_001839272.2 hypothetical protein CC1G_10994 [Coprinopsis cinerea okayama7\